jgi:hypothetical protein
MKFNLGWSGWIGGFDHEGYHWGDDRYRDFDQQQNWTIRNPKLDLTISPKKIEAPRQPCSQWVCKSESSAEISESGHDKKGSRGESLINDGVEQNPEKGPEKVIMEQDKAQGKKIETRVETGTSSQR